MNFKIGDRVIINYGGPPAWQGILGEVVSVDNFLGIRPDTMPATILPHVKILYVGRGSIEHYCIEGRKDEEL